MGQRPEEVRLITRKDNLGWIVKNLFFIAGELTHQSTGCCRFSSSVYLQKILQKICWGGSSKADGPNLFGMGITNWPHTLQVPLWSPSATCSATLPQYCPFVPQSAMCHKLATPGLMILSSPLHWVKMKMTTWDPFQLYILLTMPKVASEAKTFYPHRFLVGQTQTSIAQYSKTQNFPSISLEQSVCLSVGTTWNSPPQHNKKSPEADSYRYCCLVF